MRTKNIKYLILLFLSTCLFLSCDDYLDADGMDDRVSIEDVFSSESDALRYLADVYGTLRVNIGWSNESPWVPISDELDVTYVEYDVNKVNNGAILPADPPFNYWARYYKGIRNATYFMQHVDDIEYQLASSNTNETFEERKRRYEMEARVLRAWFYFNLFQQYGPLILLDEELIPSDASIDQITIPRSSISETVAFIESELDIAIESGYLPKTRGDKQAEMDYGRITEAICHAIKSRLLLYAASDFYNGDINPYYKDFKNKDGKLLFDYTNQEKIARWEKAAKASKDVLDMNIFSLYKEYDNDGEIDPYNSYRNVFQVMQNVEVIFSRRGVGWSEMDLACTPKMVHSNAWNGWGPTQQMVDAFFTVNGLSIDEDPTYTEQGFSTTASTEYGGYARGTFNMYVNREPRFYASITFNNCNWIAENNKNVVQFYMGGNSGYHERTNARNYSRTGYLCRKFVSPTSNVANGNYTAREFIYFRLTEIYLNYIEALNEVSFENNKTEILYYINQIRERAGIPLYGDNAGQIPVNSQDRMRELIRKERRVELSFESHRYFDCKRWLISEYTDGGDFYGMNVYEPEDGFHERTVFEYRSFQMKNYLWPIKTSEVYKNNLMVQNPGWSTLE